MIPPYIRLSKSWEQTKADMLEALLKVRAELAGGDIPTWRRVELEKQRDLLDERLRMFAFVEEKMEKISQDYEREKS